MPVHGSERSARDHAFYVRSEAIAMNERLRDVEDQLRKVLKRLDAVEAQLTNGHGPEQSG